MKPLYIIKTGSTFPDTLKHYGDFDQWILAAMGPEGRGTLVADAQNEAPLPEPERCAGIIITGSHSMVTDTAPWQVRLEEWVKRILAAGVPVFGLCYGHQLLARAAGGEAGFHPAGREVGTVRIRGLDACGTDPLFSAMPASFPAHATHAQTVLTLPPGAVCLAENSHDPHHAFRVGENAWGVQFHPEFNEAIMTEYILKRRADLAAGGLDPDRLVRTVCPTPESAGLLPAFAALVEMASKKSREPV